MRAQAKKSKRGTALPWERPASAQRGRGPARPAAATARAAKGADRAKRAMSWLVTAPLVVALLYGVFVSFDPAAAEKAVATGFDGLAVRAGLGLKKVTVSGRSAASSAQIRKALALDLGTPLFRIDCEEARQRLLKLDWVESADVRRLLPNRIHVTITERKPIAIWQHDGALKLIDATGHAIAAVSADALNSYPHVVGADAPMYTASLLDVLARFPDIESRVTAAVRVSDRRWRLELDNGTRVELPKEGLETALSDLVRLEKEQKVIERGARTVDLRFKDKWIVQMPAAPAGWRPAGAKDT